MPNQKFASGSGIIDYGEIPAEILKLVYDSCKKLNMPSWMSFDIMKDNEDKWVIGEISVINGDLKSKDIYDMARHYSIINDEIVATPKPNDIQEYFITSLLKKWGWIE